VAQAPPGFYKVRLTAAAHLADRPDYIPNFRYQANDRLVFQADSPIRDGKLSQEFVFAHTQGNLATIDFNWVNGFSTNAGRAPEFRQPGWVNSSFEFWNPNDLPRVGQLIVAMLQSPLD
jgi:hypothetical protein